jgi:hypothetical protein
LDGERNVHRLSCSGKGEYKLNHSAPQLSRGPLGSNSDAKVLGRINMIRRTWLFNSVLLMIAFCNNQLQPGQSVDPFLYEDVQDSPSTVFDISSWLKVGKNGPLYFIRCRIDQMVDSIERWQTTKYTIDLYRDSLRNKVQEIKDSADGVGTFGYSGHQQDADYGFEGGENLQNVAKLSGANNEFIQFVDMNFDGYKDLRLLQNIGANGSMTYNYWLFLPSRGIFRFHQGLSDSCCCYPALDSSAKEIWVSSDWSTRKYRFSKGNLILVEYAKGEEVEIQGTLKHKVTTYRRVNGKFKSIKVEYREM